MSIYNNGINNGIVINITKKEDNNSFALNNNAKPLMDYNIQKTFEDNSTNTYSISKNSCRTGLCSRTQSSAFVQVHPGMDLYEKVDTSRPNPKYEYYSGSSSSGYKTLNSNSWVETSSMNPRDYTYRQGGFPAGINRSKIVGVNYGGYSRPSGVVYLS